MASKKAAAAIFAALHIWKFFEEKPSEKTVFSNEGLWPELRVALLMRRCDEPVYERHRLVTQEVEGEAAAVSSLIMIV